MVSRVTHLLGKFYWTAVTANNTKFGLKDFGICPFDINIFPEEQLAAAGTTY
jgi:hypothetical protein